MSDTISVRALMPDDWEILRSARLKALQEHPGVYLSSYKVEAEMPETKWKETLDGKGKYVVALFDNDRLIGFAGVFTWRGDPPGRRGGSWRWIISTRLIAGEACPDSYIRDGSTGRLTRNSLQGC